MFKKVALIVVCALVLSLGSVAAAKADAPPPVGSWSGTFADGSTLQVFVGGNGLCSYGVPGAQPTGGNWS